MFNTGKLFDTQFEPVEGGYRYHPWPWSKGYLVTEDEFQRTRAEYLSASSWRFMGQMALYLAAVSVVLAFATLSLGGTIKESDWVMYILIAPLIGLVIWRIFAPQRLVWGREPFAPRRTREEQDKHAAVAFGWLPIALMIAVSVLWIALEAYLLTNENWWGLAVIAITIPSLFRTWRTIQFKLKTP